MPRPNTVQRPFDGVVPGRFASHTINRCHVALTCRWMSHPLPIFDNEEAFQFFLSAPEKKGAYENGRPISPFSFASSLYLAFGIRTPLLRQTFRKKVRHGFGKKGIEGRGGRHLLPLLPLQHSLLRRSPRPLRRLLDRLWLEKVCPPSLSLPSLFLMLLFLFLFHYANVISIHFIIRANYCLHYPNLLM